MIKKRVVIYAKDIQIITGRSQRYSNSMLTKIRKYFQKEAHQYVTLDEFSEFSGIPIHKIEQFIS
ncbi:hypothetical protein [Algoriphagus terrigena]|uniref:hypothetical protein n=1 Tax=Algoriphagus terrigena TaxID=344884 RepID=UPI0003FEF7B8|nr:hypothetical protein [Algoriphagus terrigena]